MAQPKILANKGLVNRNTETCPDLATLIKVGATEIGTISLYTT